MNSEAVRKLLIRQVESADSLRKWSESHDISASHVSRVCRDEKDFGEAILGILGLERVVSYRRKNGGGK